MIRTAKDVISGFQSPLEKKVFGCLLEAPHPIIWALGRALYKRYPPQVEQALAEGRILVFTARNAARATLKAPAQLEACTEKQMHICGNNPTSIAVTPPLCRPATPSLYRSRLYSSAISDSIPPLHSRTIKQRRRFEVSAISRIFIGELQTSIRRQI